MAALSKRQKAFKGKIDANKTYPVGEALKLAREYATAKFDESIDVAVCLGVDPRKSDQIVRGSVVLPAKIMMDAPSGTSSSNSRRPTK